VIDLFREWDDDASGHISRKEFRKAMQELGCEIERKYVDELFDQWDPDKSGTLEIAELNKQLRQTVELDPSLKAGAKGEIEVSRDQKYALRTAEIDKTNSMLLQGFDIDETSGKPVSQQLRDELAKNMVRVIDLFREWDDDASGAVSKKEFRKAMQELGCEIERKHVDALFDQWDPDKSGTLQIAELNKQLRQTVELDPSLKAGGAGEIEMGIDQKAALRKQKVDKAAASALQGIDLDEDSPLSVAEQLREALAKSAMRVVDLFREWDDDHSGTVSKKEFRKAMPMLGLSVPTADIDALFEAWDPDKSGAIEIKELNKLLRRPVALARSPPKKKGPKAPKIAPIMHNKFATRKGKSDGPVLGTLDLDEDSEVSIRDQLRTALTARAIRVIDLFRDWDDDDSGSVTKKEFRKAMPVLGLDVSVKEMDAIFDEFDPDGSGSIGYAELKKSLTAKPKPEGKSDAKSDTKGKGTKGKGR